MEAVLSTSEINHSSRNLNEKTNYIQKLISCTAITDLRKIGIFGGGFSLWDVGGMDWIKLAHDRDGLRALVNAIMNFRFP
jgi:hypothetical protein